MKIKTIYLILLTLLIPVITGCGATTGSADTPGNTPTISVSGSGTATAKPDQVTLQLGVESVSTDPAEAISENTDRMKAVMDVLTSMNIAESDIQTVNYFMWVEDVYDMNGPTGEKRYHVSNQLSVRLDDLEQTGLLLEKATSAGANSIGGVTFSVADTTELKQNALENAILDAKAKAQRLAADLDLELGAVKSVVEGVSASMPTPYYAETAAGGAGIPISSGQFSVTIQVQVTFEVTP